MDFFFFLKAAICEDYDGVVVNISNMTGNMYFKNVHNTNKHRNEKRTKKLRS